MKISKKDASLPASLGEYVAAMSPEDFGELRVLIYILSSEGELDTAEIEESLGMTDSEVNCAVAFWRGAGLLSSGKKTDAQGAKKENREEKEKLPESVRDTDTRSYTGKEIADIMEAKPELQSLLKYAQDRLGKIFSPSDISKLIYLVDYILLTPAMVMLIIEYCVEIEKKSMRYIEKTAISIYDEGIESYEALEAYFDSKRRRSSRQGIVKSIVGIGERNFTSKECALIDRWFDEFESSRELITLAFEKTVSNISKPSLPYMSKLLEKWHEEGYKTADDVENGRKGEGGRDNINLDLFDEAKGNAKNVDSAGLDLEDFFENQ